MLKPLSERRLGGLEVLPFDDLVDQRLLSVRIGMAALVLGVNWALNGFHGLGLHLATAIALVLGTIAATVLCVVLMGLMFYSECTQDDEETYERHTTERWR